MAVKIETIPTVAIVTGGTAVPVSAQSLHVTSVTIQADSANVGDVYFGDSTVTAINGQAISAMDTIQIEGPVGPRGYAEEFDLSKTFINSSTSGNKVRVIAFRRAI